MATCLCPYCGGPGLFVGATFNGVRYSHTCELCVQAAVAMWHLGLAVQRFLDACSLLCAPSRLGKVFVLPFGTCVAEPAEAPRNRVLSCNGSTSSFRCSV